jgi:hypothetical protein
MPEMVQAAIFSIPLPGRVNEREIARLADSVRAVLGGREKTIFERHRYIFRKANADKASGRDRASGADQPHCFAGRDDLARMLCAQRLEDLAGLWQHRLAPIKSPAVGDTTWAGP